MQAIAYKGLKRNSGVGRQRVFKNMPDGTTIPLLESPSRELRDHSVEFNFGYCGSGPAQLALAILLDVTGDPEVSLLYYQWFKEGFIATLGKSWVIEASEVREWLAKEKQEAVK
ncbi:MAG: hypothetical protein KAR06_04820 [Deltaproteobacteria bacterium]|nr:hypothetical protein [Deltaproteobacteria bacterium]